MHKHLIDWRELGKHFQLSATDFQFFQRYSARWLHHQTVADAVEEVSVQQEEDIVDESIPQAYKIDFD